jgi:hypothetical protein
MWDTGAELGRIFWRRRSGAFNMSTESDFVINHRALSGQRLSKAHVHLIQETTHKMVRAFEIDNPCWQNLPDDKIMYKYKDEWLKPGTINRSSLSQRVHSEEIGDRLFDITGEDPSILGKVVLGWSQRWIDSDSLA